MGEDLECLCQIMKTVGPKLDHEKARVSRQTSRSHQKKNNQTFLCVWTNGELFLAVFNGSVLWPHEVLNHQQGASVSHSVPAAEHRGAARERLGATQGSHRQRTKDNQPNSSGCSKSQCRISLKWLHDCLVYSPFPHWFSVLTFCLLQDLGVFIPPPTDAMRNDFFMENAFLPGRIKFDANTFGGLADMFGQMPGTLLATVFVRLRSKASTNPEYAILIFRPWISAESISIRYPNEWWIPSLLDL